MDILRHLFFIINLIINNLQHAPVPFFPISPKQTSNETAIILVTINTDPYNMKYTFALSLLLFALCGRTYAQIDVSVADVFPLTYQVPGTHHFDVALRATGSSGIGMFNVSWQLNGGTVQTVQKGPGTGMDGHVTDPAFTVTLPSAGTYTFKLWVQSFSVADTNPLNDTILRTIKVFNALPKKNVVLEVFKHLACCPCYDAAVYEDTFINQNSTYAIANIYTVSTDAIYNLQGDSVNAIYDNGHPMPLLDRYKFGYLQNLSSSFYSLCSSYTLESYGEREQYYEPASVSFKSMIYNASTRELKVKLNAKFYDDLSGDYRFNLYLTEDSILSYQACATNPNNYYHMFVVREMLGGSWGQQGSLPATIHNNDQDEYEFTYTIPAAYNTNNMKLIGFVQTYNTDSFSRRILNSTQMSFKDGLSLSAKNVTTSPVSIKVYPNPASNTLYIHPAGLNNQNYTISIYDMAGKRVYQAQKAADTEINITDLSPANYIIKIEDKNQVHSEMFRKE